MDLKQLRYFLAINKYGSIAKAANKIYISQQGLSMALLRLENELNCRLMERTPDGMKLTREGEYLLPKAEKLVADSDEIEDFFLGDNAHHLPINISCCLGALPEFLAPVLFSFQKDHPEYNVDITETNDTDAIRCVEKKEVELGFSISPIDSDALAKFPVFSAPLCLLVHRSSPLAELKYATAAEVLNDNPVMLMNPKAKTCEILQKYCQENEIRLQVQYYAAEVIAIHRMVAADLGMGISVYTVAEDLAMQNVVAIPFREKELVWELNILRRKDTVLSPQARKFEQYVFNYRDAHESVGGRFGNFSQPEDYPRS